MLCSLGCRAPPPLDTSRLPQVLLGSHALDLLLDGCVDRGAAPSDAAGLSQLLAAVAHPSVPPAYTAAVAAAVASLGQACAVDQRAPAPAAKRAAAAALGLVRSGLPKPPASKAAEPAAAALRRLESELERQEARLAGLAQPRDQAKAYGSLLSLLCAQLDLLRPAGGAADGALAPPAVRALDDLRALLAARLQVGTVQGAAVLGWVLDRILSLAVWELHCRCE